MASEALSRARAHALDVLEWQEIASALATRCASAAAARRASALLPDLGLEEARRSLLETEEARRLLMEEEGVPVAGVRDVARVVDLAARGAVAEAAELADVARTLDSLGRLRKVLDGCEQDAPLLHERARAIVPAPALVAAIDRAIDERGVVKDDATPRLAELHRRKLAVSSRIERTVDSLRRSPDVAACLTDDFVTVRDGRHVLPVRSDRRQGVQGILHGRSGSGQSLFIEPAAIVDLNNELAGVALDVEEEVARILRELSSRIGEQAEPLRDALEAHAAIDLAVARARLAQALDAFTPEILEPGEPGLELTELAHPRLLLLQPPGGRSKIVRNDVRLEEPRRGILVTGPNTGGKTVLLEAIGLACLMVRAGLTPATGPGSRVPFLDAVLADIGDEQSLERSLSSFSGHVAQLQDILGACDELGGRALVLVDEIMAGTDPAEGAPLAQAMLEAFARTGALVVATTHLGFLKAFAAESGVFENAGMEFDEATLRATYRLRVGVPGASAAFLVAERLGLPGGVIARARELADAGHVSVEALLLDLERAREEGLRAREEARQAAAEAGALRAQLERQLEQVRSRDAQFMRDERAAFEREIKALREQAAEITRRLQAEPGHAASAEAVRKLEELKARAREAGIAQPATAPPPVELARGLKVRSRSMEKVGEIVDPPDGRGRVRVRFGHLTLQVGVEDLVPAAGGGMPPAPRAKRPPGGVLDEAPRAVGAVPGEAEEAVPFTPQTSRNTLDLRGSTVDEALAEVAKFLERASSGGERCVVLIHGHGTGALKSAVRSELKRDPLVQAFRAGREGEGADGVTVARLR